MTIDEAIEQNKKIIIKAYSVSESIEYFLKVALTKVLHNYGCDMLLIPLYTSVKELVVNAVKANHKFIYFEGRKSYNSVFFDSEKALQLFKLEMTRGDAHYFDLLARKQNLYAMTTMSVIDRILYIDVENPIPMSDIEKEAVGKKLKIAQDCQDITDYFIQSQEDDYKEGAGLGLVLITMMFKGMGLSQKHFFIDSDFEKTIASMHVPLTATTIQEYKKRLEETTPKSA
ncbi:MAG: hypothetical protein KAY16_03880 [Spirochaetes bacterium]|nr:hypothetical protein [Spirochaetota bacterium]